MRLVSSRATVPLAKVTAAETSSACGPYWVRPRALTSATALSTSVCTRSRSWIIRSSTALTSSPRPGPGTAAPALDFQRRFGLVEQAGARRRRNVPDGRRSAPGRSCAASATRSLASSMVVAMGFSTSTWAPAFRKARTISAWVTAGEQMLTRSTLPRSSRQSATASTPYWAARCGGLRRWDRRWRRVRHLAGSARARYLVA